MTSTPLVSALVTAYRRPGYLAEAVESVLAQTFTDFELIVVEDGSHDGEPVVRRYADPRVRYEWQRNQGQAAARNKAVRLARAEWVAFLDDDDRWLPRKLERQTELAAHFPSLGLIHTDFFDLKDGVLRPRVSQFRTADIPSGWITGALFLRFFGLPSTIMVRRAVFEQAGGFDSSFPVCEDYDLLLRLSRLCQFGYLAEPLVAHRLHEGSVSDDEPARIADSLAVLGRFLDRYPGVREECGGRAVQERLAGLHHRRGRALFWRDDFIEARREFYTAWRLRPEHLSWLALLLAAALPARAIRVSRAVKRALAHRPPNVRGRMTT